MFRHLVSLIPVAVSEDLHFLAMGDWGGSAHSPYTTSAEVNTAKGMNKVAGSLGAKFALALGDNFYDHGLDSVDSDRFDKTFEQCFDGSNLQASNGFTFHVVAGNHDHLGNVQAQIDYSSKSERWSFPSQYYSFSETAPDGATVDIVLFDTVQLSGISDHENFVKGSELPGPLDATVAGAQLDWLEKTLSASTADYLIVGGHYPVYSIAEHGPTKQLQPDKFPYFRDNRISAYLCGHDHNQQFIDVGDGIQYHVIGSAHLGDSSTSHMSTISKDQLKFHAHDGGGFSTISVNKQGMVIKHLDASGNVVYTAPTILPRGSSPTPAPTPPTPVPSPTPAGDWECQSNKKAVIGTDQNLKHISDDRADCLTACGSDCTAIYWHKTDNHCHVLSGDFTHDDWTGKLSSDSDYDSCCKTSGAETNLLV
jgi:tartrate-resistant acid phosphatase type 5